MADGRRVFVVGASRGIGLELVRRLLGEGCRVGAYARDPAPLRMIEAGTLSIFTGDVTVEGDLRAAVDGFAASQDGLDMLIYAANRADAGHVEDVPEAATASLMRTNLDGVLAAAAAAWPHLRRGTRPAILFLSSIAASAGVPGFAAYAASKAGTRSVCEALAIEWRRYRIAVVEVVLGRLDAGDGQFSWYRDADAAPVSRPTRPMKPLPLFRAISLPLAPADAARRILAADLGRSGRLYIPRAASWYDRFTRRCPGLHRPLMRLFWLRRVPAMLGGAGAADDRAGRARAGARR